MIDTIKVISPIISDETYRVLKAISFEKLEISNENNVILYKFTNIDLQGSFDRKIKIKLRTDRQDKFFSLDTGKYEIITKYDADPFLEIEFSIHKFFMGHNIFGGSNNLLKYFEMFINFIEAQFNVNLPSFLDWEIRRLDYAETFKIPHVEDFFKYMKNCSYPRRKTYIYDTTIMFPGQTTTVRIYSKEHEFKVHDLNHLRKNKNVDIIKLLRESKNILRAEVQINPKKMREINGGENMKISQYNENFKAIQGVYTTEICKIFKLKETNRVYSDAKSVYNILHESFSSEKANSLFSTFTQISIFGLEEVRGKMPKSTYYRHLRIFKEIGISVVNSDIQIREEINPYSDFVPTLDSKYKVS
jgi:II/X family phage/plasmid replication protein